MLLVSILLSVRGPILRLFFTFSSTPALPSHILHLPSLYGIALVCWSMGSYRMTGLALFLLCFLVLHGGWRGTDELDNGRGSR